MKKIKFSKLNIARYKYLVCGTGCLFKENQDCIPKPDLR